MDVIKLNFDQLKKDHWSEQEADNAKLILQFVQRIMNNHEFDLVLKPSQIDFHCAAPSHTTSQYCPPLGVGSYCNLQRLLTQRLLIHLAQASSVADNNQTAQHLRAGFELIRLLRALH